MVIDLFLHDEDSNYYVDPQERSLVHFANNTLCLRREMLDELGLYNENVMASEDVELCSRVVESSWLMYRCPRMVLRHRGRASLMGLLRQWWGYGWEIPGIFRARNEGDFEVVLALGQGRLYRLFHRFSTPVTVCVFVHPFLLMHLFCWAAASLALLGALKIALPAALMALICLGLYLQPELSCRSPGLRLILVRYLVNVAFCLAHLAGGARAGCLYLPQVVWEVKE